jgi:5-oxoprolinase (ATP-hydrolysing)
MRCFFVFVTQRVFEKQEPSSETFSGESLIRLKERIKVLEDSVRGELKNQGFKEERIKIESYLNLR